MTAFKQKAIGIIVNHKLILPKVAVQTVI